MIRILKSLKKSLSKLESIDSDIIFFKQVLIHLKSDRYGKLELSIRWFERLETNYVYKFAKKRKNPILLFMGGGYTKPINKTVKAFKNLFLESSIFFKDE